MQTKVSVFANVNPSSFKGHHDFESAIKMIRISRFKLETDHLRTLTDPEAARIYKAGRQDKNGHLVEPGHFYGMTVAGTFEGGKTAANLLALSGLTVIDIDGLTAEEVAELIEKLRADEYTHAYFISPSGNGVKWIVRIDIKHVDEYKRFFNQLTDYLHNRYRLTRKEDVLKGTKPKIDPSGKNVDRLCFFAHDPNVYYNPDSAPVLLHDKYRNPPTVEPPKNTEPTERYVLTEAIEDRTHRLLTESISQLTAQAIDLTDNYEDWIEIGFALASLGNEGRIYFHEVSRINPKYDYQQCDAKFTELIRNRDGRVNIGTFFTRCEQAMGKTWEQAGAAHTCQIDNCDDKQSTEWDTPRTLDAPLLPVLPITPSMIPEPLQPWLQDIANRMKCPLDFVAVGAAVMVATLIGTRLSIKPKTRDDWTVIPNLWGAVVGDPSMMKTPAVAEVFKPLNRLMTEARTKFEDQQKQYETSMLTYEAQKKVYQAQEQNRLKGIKVNNPVDYPEPPTKPTERRYIVNDATVEKLAQLLNENLAGLLVWRDELMGLLAGWNRAGREEDRAFYLEGWNGNGSKTVDRIGRGTIHVKALCVSLFGGIQPSKLLGYLHAASSYENDGLVQRLQLAVYPDRPQWEYTDEYPNAHAREVAYRVIRQIADSDFTSIAYDADEYNLYPFTRFDADAQGIFKQWLINLETSVLPAESGLLLEHFTKYRSLMPSLALVFHVINCTSGSEHNSTVKWLISADAANMAVQWCTYLMSHARRIYGLLDNVSITAAKELLRHLKARNLTDGFKVRDVTKKGWSNLNTNEKVDAALSELIAAGWVREVKSPSTMTGRPPAPEYLINPKIFQNA